MRRKRIGRGVNPKGSIRNKMFSYQVATLETELVGVENAIANAMCTVDRKELEQKRGEILGKLKKLITR